MENQSIAASLVWLRNPQDRDAEQTEDQPVDSGSGSQRNSVTLSDLNKNVFKGMVHLKNNMALKWVEYPYKS